MYRKYYCITHLLKVRLHQRWTMQSLTPKEMLKVLKVASESKRNHAMILFAFRFGMRASEVCDLRLSDIDRKNGTVTIRRLKGSQNIGRPDDERARPAVAVRYARVKRMAGRAAMTQRLRVHQSEGRQTGPFGVLSDVPSRSD